MYKLHYYCHRRHHCCYYFHRSKFSGQTCGLIPTTVDVEDPVLLMVLCHHYCSGYGNGPSQKICNDETFPVLLTWSLVGHHQDPDLVLLDRAAERAVQIEKQKMKFLTVNLSIIHAYAVKNLGPSYYHIIYLKPNLKYRPHSLNVCLGNVLNSSYIHTPLILFISLISAPLSFFSSHQRSPRPTATFLHLIFSSQMQCNTTFQCRHKALSKEKAFQSASEAHYEFNACNAIQCNHLFMTMLLIRS